MALSLWCTISVPHLYHRLRMACAHAMVPYQQNDCIMQKLLNNILLKAAAEKWDCTISTIVIMYVATGKI